MQKGISEKLPPSTEAKNSGLQNKGQNESESK